MPEQTPAKNTVSAEMQAAFAARYTEFAMARIRIDVECYAGARADEHPRRIIVQRCEHVVSRLVSESLEESVDRGERTHFYQVLTSDGLVLELLRIGDHWYLESD